MVTFDLLDRYHIRSNPWADTGYGKGQFYLASDPSGGVSEAQQRQRQQFADAASQAAAECSGKSGMAKNVCRARETSNRL